MCTGELENTEVQELAIFSQSAVLKYNLDLKNVKANEVCGVARLIVSVECIVDLVRCGHITMYECPTVV